MTEPQQSNQEFITLTVKWNTQEMSITLPGDSTVFVLKEKLEELTHVRAERQKLLGLTVKGKLAKDDVRVMLFRLCWVNYTVNAFVRIFYVR